MLLSSRPLPRRPTIKDIANAVGLHFSTVSRALRGDRRISPETRERIAAVAEELGYVRDPVLDSLIEYRTKTGGTKVPSLAFAVVVGTKTGRPVAEQRVESTVCDAAMRCAIRLGFDAGNYSVEPSREAVRELGVQLSADGVVCGVVYVNLGGLAEYADSLGLRYPTLLGSNVRLNIHSVDTDTQQALALARLVQGGRHRIALALAGPTIGTVAARFYGDYLSEMKVGPFRSCLLAPFIGSELRGPDWEA